MSLKAKYLWVLNDVILSMWTIYAAWSLHKTEEQFMLYRGHGRDTRHRVPPVQIRTNVEHMVMGS